MWIYLIFYNSFLNRNLILNNFLFNNFFFYNFILITFIYQLFWNSFFNDFDINLFISIHLNTFKQFNFYIVLRLVFLDFLKLFITNDLDRALWDSWQWYLDNFMNWFAYNFTLNSLRLWMNNLFFFENMNSFHWKSLMDICFFENSLTKFWHFLFSQSNWIIS